MKGFRALFIDDFAKEREAVSRRLACERLSVETERPPSPLDASFISFVRNSDPDIVLLDYELTGKEADTQPAAYFGTTLAAAIRDVRQDYPIVVVTRGGFAEWETSKHLVERQEVFDGIILKSTLATNASDVAAELVALADGFERLRACERTWSGLLDLLGASPTEDAELRESAPPLHRSADAGEASWQVAEAARWIRNVVVRFPGILYSPVYSATLLGIDVTSFAASEVQEAFSDCRYVGPFCPAEGRWWKRRLLEKAATLLALRGSEGQVNTAFAPAFEDETDFKLKPARCVSSGESPADSVCYVLNEPVKMRYSLAYFPDNRPPVMDEARVSFKAIRETNDAYDELLSPDVLPLVARIRRGART